MSPRTAREVRNYLLRYHRCAEDPRRDDPRRPLVPAWLLAFEVPVNTTRYKGVDFGQRTVDTKQRIDAVAVGLWEKRTAHEIRGLEIKVSRSDLLAELRDPGKASAGAAQCDSWWLALSDPKLLRDGDDLPHGWGVLACVGRGMRVIHPAETKAGERSHQFIAGLMSAQLRAPTYRRAAGYTAGYQNGARDQRSYSKPHVYAATVREMCHWRQGRGDARSQTHEAYHFGDEPGQTGVCPYEAMAAVLLGEPDPRDGAAL